MAGFSSGPAAVKDTPYLSLQHGNTLRAAAAAAAALTPSLTAQIHVCSYISSPVLCAPSAVCINGLIWEHVTEWHHQTIFKLCEGTSGVFKREKP